MLPNLLSILESAQDFKKNIKRTVKKSFKQN